MRKAFIDKLLSINPLEYVVALFAVRIWLGRWQGMGMPRREEGELVVGRCEKEAALFVSRRRMAVCPSMEWCTEKQWKLEHVFSVQVVLDHIPGADNVAPDALT